MLIKLLILKPKVKRENYYISITKKHQRHSKSIQILPKTGSVTLIQYSRTLQEPIHPLWSRREMNAARRPPTTPTTMSAFHLVFVVTSSNFGLKGSAREQ